MQAERMRAEVVAANMANAETTRTATGGPYRRQQVIFAANRGDPGFLDSMSSASAFGSSGRTKHDVHCRQYRSGNQLSQRQSGYGRRR